MKRIITLFKRAHTDSLYRNSLYLMASNYIMGFIGFFFWMIVTRLYSPQDVGLATTLISITGLITSFSLFGFNTALVRFLPSSKNKNNMINTAFTLIAIGSILITLCFIAGLPLFAPRLLFIRTSPVFAISFVVFMIIASLNAITDSVFIAERDTKYIPITYTLMSLVKLVLPVFLVSLGAYGIFYSFLFSVNVAMVLSILLLTFLFGYKFIPGIDFKEVRKMWKFSFGNYLAGFFGGLPPMVIPLIITNTLGPKVTAYYFMPSMIITLLLAIPRSITQSLFSEGSFDENSLKQKSIKATKTILLILTPAVFAVIFLGKYILLAFGKEYSSEGLVYLQLTTFSILISIPNYIIGVLLNVEKKIGAIVLLMALSSISNIALTYLLLDRGLMGLGLAGIISQIISTLLFITVFLYRN